MSELFEAYSDLDDLVEQLASDDPGERRVAVMELADLGDPAVIPILRGVVTDPDAGVRSQCAKALGEYDGALAAEALAEFVVDNDPDVAKAAAFSMAELKEPGGR